MDYSGLRIGPQILSDGVSQATARGTREGAELCENLTGFYEEAVLRGQVFSLSLPLTTGNVVAAGNIILAAAAASTQFALCNPANSGKNLVLLEFALAFDVATTAQMPSGPIFHGYMPGCPTAAGVGTIQSAILGGGAASVARGYASAGGATLTGGAAPVAIKLANFATTNTTQASPYLIPPIEYIDGKMVVPPGAGWLPLFNVAGSVNFAYGVGVTWREVPV
jgi:hypothetical protein